MFSRLFAAELRVQGSAIWPSPRRMPVLFSLLLGVCLWMLLRYAHQLAAKETISPKVEAAMAAKHAASILCGTNFQNKNTVAPMVSICSRASETAVESDSSTARK